jgi:type III pantothenate kinase
MSTWLFDLGNTRLKCAPLSADGRVGDVVALPHRIEDVAEALAAALPEHIDVAHLASVASPELTATVLETLTRHSRRICMARTQTAFAGMRIAYAQPHKLGVDRFLALLALHARGEPALACGVGTALTIDLIDGDGMHRGGRIAPSPTLMREALHARAAQLPVQGGEYDEFAADTEDALASGCEGAALALIERSVQTASRLLGVTPILHLHGGGAAPLLPNLLDAQWSPGLVLEGLARWAQGEVAMPAPRHG